MAHPFSDEQAHAPYRRAYAGAWDLFLVKMDRLVKSPLQGYFSLHRRSRSVSRERDMNGSACTLRGGANGETIWPM